MKIECKFKILERVFVLTEKEVREMVQRESDFPKGGLITNIEWDNGWGVYSCGDPERRREPSVRVTVHEREVVEKGGA